MQVLSGHIFCHVPCPHFNYRQKAVYIAICLRRMMAAILDPVTCLDDRCGPFESHPALFPLPPVHDAGLNRYSQFGIFISNYHSVILDRRHMRANLRN